MNQLITVFISNIPVDCHILKGRLESEGISCFIYDENLVWVDPFKAVAIGGVKLKVPADKYIQTKTIMNLIKEDRLTDADGDYNISAVFTNEIKRQNEILAIKSQLRKDPSLLDKTFTLESKFLDRNDFDGIVESEREFQKMGQKKFSFSWQQFLYELFDFDRDVFKYLRPKPVEYYLEKEMVENYVSKKEPEQITNCPNCNSDNTAFGYAIDYKWDVLYLVLSFVIGAPLYLIRKKFHCFNCGHNFKAN